MKRRVYRALEVNQVRWEALVADKPSGAVTVGLDIGKYEMYAVVRWADSTFERPWRVQNPTGIPRLIELLRGLGGERAVTVALESTGTYGDALRRQLAAAELPVERVGSKAAHDYAEVFDGVPSQHDGKDAAILAELSAFGKAVAWPYVSVTNTEREMAYWVGWLDSHQRVQTMWANRLESLLARHWPELTRILPLNSVTLLRMLAHYGGPAAVAQDATAAEQLASWSRCAVQSPRIGRIVTSASTTLGVPPAEREVDGLRQYAALAAAREVTRAAYRKAMGLNLKERSSGRHKGKLKITRRGPALVRRWMYFAAMRLAQRAEIRGWYQAKKTKDKARGKGALIAVARKLALALYHMGAHGAEFDAARLFLGLPARPAVAPPVTTVPHTDTAVAVGFSEVSLRCPKVASIEQAPGDGDRQGPEAPLGAPSTERSLDRLRPRRA